MKIINLPQIKPAFISLQKSTAFSLHHILKVALSRILFFGSFLKLALIKAGCPFFGRYYDRIDRNVYLGAIPLKCLGMEKELKALGVTKTLAFLERWEMEGCGIMSSYCPPFLRDHRQEIAVDHVTLSVAQIKEGVKFIEEAAFLRQKIYVHCKAGAGRSATCVAAYLIKRYDLLVEEACNRLKSKRPNVKFNADRIEQLNKYRETLIDPIELQDILRK